MITRAASAGPLPGQPGLYSRSGVRTHLDLLEGRRQPWKSSITRCRSTAAGQRLNSILQWAVAATD